MVDLALHDEIDAALTHHRDVEAGPAHVDADDVRFAEHPAEQGAGSTSTRRTGQQEAHRLPRRRLDAADAAIRLHQQQARSESFGPHARGKLVEIAGDDRYQQCVEDGRRRALIFADFGTEGTGTRDLQCGPRRRDGLGDRALVSRVEIRIEQADRDRDHVQLVELPDELFDCGGRQRRLDGAIRLDTLLDADTAVTRDQRRWHLRIERIDLASIVTADLDDVLESCRRDQRPLGEFPLEHRIGGDGRAVQQIADVREGETVELRRLPDARHEADRRVLRRCERLEAADRTRARIEDLKVGKGPADVDADSDRRRGGCRRSAAACSLERARNR